MDKTTQKPKCKLVGKNGNIFNLVGLASKALRKAGQNDKCGEMQQRVFSSKSYTEALAVLCEYVEAY